MSEKRVLAIKNLTFYYKKDNPIYKDFSLELNKGDLVTIFGKSGTGKTTLFELISGSLKPINGTIEKSKIAMIFQDPYNSFHPTYSIIEQIKDIVGKISQNELEGFLIKLTLEKDNEKHKIVSVIKRAKMLMLSVNESYEPCYYEPTSVVVQEIVAKLNIALFNYKLDDNSVKELISVANKQIENKDNSAYLTVYKLGFSNNPLALDFIYEHTKHTYPDYVRFSSISTLGMLGGEKYLDYLINIYNNSSYAWEDKIMALKSIGDINSSKGNIFLEKTYKELGDKKDFEKKAQKNTIELYIK